MELVPLALYGVPPPMMGIDKPLHHKKLDHVLDGRPVTTPAYRKVEPMQLSTQSGFTTEFAHGLGGPVNLQMSAGVGGKGLAEVLVAQDRRPPVFVEVQGACGLKNGQVLPLGVEAEDEATRSHARGAADDTVRGPGKGLMLDFVSPRATRTRP